MQFYPIDEIDAYEAAHLLIGLRKRGVTFYAIDAMIAAVAIRNNLVLLTTDQDFRAIPQLKHANWLS